MPCDTLHYFKPVRTLPLLPCLCYTSAKKVEESSGTKIIVCLGKTSKGASYMETKICNSKMLEESPKVL